MIPFKVKSKLLPGSNYAEVHGGAWRLYLDIEAKTKRRPYARSAFFKKEKVFFEYFWAHLRQKPPKERMKRLRYFTAAIELISYSRNKPTAQPNANRPEETVYRFYGITSDHHEFFVQIKETKKGKYFMSCFPK